MPTITLDWKFFTMLLAAVAGVIVPIFLWQLDISSRSLTVRLISTVALQPEAGPNVQDLKIVLDGVNIELPYFSTLELINDGSKPITMSDFETPLEIRLNKDRQVVRAQISTSQPSNIPADLDTNKNIVKLKPLLLNPKDSLTITIITSGGAPVFEPQARISGVSKILYEDTTTPKSAWKKIMLLPLALLSYLLYMFFAVFLLYPNTVPISRLLAFGSMLVFVNATIVFMLIAFKAIGIEDNVLNFAVFMIIGSVIGSPILFRQLRKSKRSQILV